MARLLEGYVGRNKANSETGGKRRAPEDWFKEAEDTGEAEKPDTVVELTVDEINKQAQEKELAQAAMSEKPKPDLHVVNSDSAPTEETSDPRVESLLARKLELETAQADLQRQLQDNREELARINLELSDDSANNNLSIAA